jgi:LysR family nitrogen assimilation transcriptional regulator
MTLRQLKYFVEIARYRNFSRAAEQLHIAQPALSQNIAALEDELGVKLFERHARGIDLSPAGHRLFDRAAELLIQFDGLKDVVADRESRPSGHVRLSVAGSLASVVIAPVLSELSQLYPDIELTATEGLSYEVRSQVESGRAHVALMPSASELEGMEWLPVFEERFMVFGAYESMESEPDPVQFVDVARRPLAVPDRAHDLRKVIERAANAIDCALDVRYELNSPPMIVAIVKQGLAYAILPNSACVEAVAAKAIACRQVVSPELTRVQGLVWRKDRGLTPAAAAVRDTVARVVREMVTDHRLHGRVLGGSHKQS